MTGQSLPVTVDREDPERLRIEWDEVPETPATGTGPAPATPVAETPEVRVSTQTVDVSDQPEVLAQVTDLLKAQGIDIAAMTGGADIRMGQPMDPQAAEQFRQSMLGMLDQRGVQRPPEAGLRLPTAADEGDDVVEALERLVRLRDAGALTPEEFAAQKARILGGR